LQVEGEQMKRASAFDRNKIQATIYNFRFYTRSRTVDEYWAKLFQLDWVTGFSFVKW
jgi:hypothetical protein